MKTENKKTKILFVCHGNICRSPSAEAIMKHYVKQNGLEEQIYCDSAGIIGYHEGDPADSRMIMHASKRHYKLTSISRPVTKNDFYDFDYIIGMDHDNINDLYYKSPNNKSREKIKLMTDYCKVKNPGYVPDPYYGGETGFELVLDILEDACENLLQELS